MQYTNFNRGIFIRGWLTGYVGKLRCDFVSNTQAEVWLRSVLVELVDGKSQKAAVALNGGAGAGTPLAPQKVP